ncbi:monoamine oxidase [Pilimelia anulata]|uniref:Monoamine oxidase n=1 Tax=Pilimelia anulata TaxID=53371 RepID=A0A8J3FD40_9ACTN|nr:FAD-dependent oxidoreductase [Pilimelia anulata]GGJ94523.1 monoamine oxidase [Pilimelia anulata]
MPESVPPPPAAAPPAPGAAASRRELLRAAAVVGGASAGLLPAMTGLVPPGAAAAAPPRARAGTGRDVIVLGAGIAGLTAAYELAELGYGVRVFEAQQRPGGRNLTARRGTVVTETGPGGTVRQTCAIDEGLYLNLGPGRLPHHHRRALRYCAELDVPLEPYVMQTRANLWQSPRGFAGRARPHRQVDFDTRGHVAQLLVKALRRGALDDELDPREKAQLVELLGAFGDLAPDGRYRGSTRAGLRRPLTVRSTMEPNEPALLADLLGGGFWRHQFFHGDDHLWQATMFQPVGGMDRIVDGFTRRLPGRIQYGAEATRITLLPDGVEVTVRQNGSTSTHRADHCLSNIPLPVLATIPANFSPGFAAAVAACRFAPTCKVGWQANRRFWESDDYQIYGGISWIDDPIDQVWYPSNDYFTGSGTLTGAYNRYEKATAFGELSVAERLRAARAAAARLHPEFTDESVVPTDRGVTIAWHRVPYQAGGWADWRDTPEHRLAYGRLLAPDGRFFVIGDQVSPLPGWQEGAMMSAEYVLGQLGGQERTAPPTVRHAPDARALTGG